MKRINLNDRDYEMEKYQYASEFNKLQEALKLKIKFTKNILVSIRI